MKTTLPEPKQRKKILNIRNNMKRKRSGHTSVQKGKRVVIFFKDGGMSEDVFLERKSTFLSFKEAGRIQVKHISKITIKK
jgi:hypothetical protein